MTWNYRVVERDGVYTIREVYYDKHGEPKMVTASEDWPCGDSLEELREDAEAFVGALDVPVLGWEVFDDA